MKTTIVRRILVAVLLAAFGATAHAQFGPRNKISYTKFDWKVYRSPHFDIHYYSGMEPFLEEIISYSESAYVKISADLDHELRFRVPLVVYRTAGEFRQTNITLREVPEGVAAFAESIQNRMVLPIDMPPDELYELIAHELVHIFEYSLLYDGYLGRALRSNPPTWLMEGLASYLAQDESNLDRMAIRDAVVNNILPSINQLNFVTFLTYRYGHAIFDFIEQEHGADGLRTFLFEYRKVLLTNNIEKAFKESFGYDVEAFDRKFNRYLRKKYFPVLLEKKSPDEYGTQIGLKRRGRTTFSPALSPSGELVAALSAPSGLELDLVVLSADDGSLVKNLTKGWSNDYQSLVAEAFAGRRDLSWSPVGDRVAVFARRENTWPILIFNAITGKKVADIVPEGIVECASPTFSPDGTKIAFEGNRDGVFDVFEIDVATREIRNVTDDEFFDANPWYADDGRTLLYNRRIGEHWKVFSLDLEDPTRRTQLTFGPSSDIQPTLSADGETAWFSSDRDEYGVYNIYALDLTTGDIEQHTDVVGGTFAPLELERGGADGERQLIFTAFFEGAFQLYRMPLGEPEARITASDRLDEPQDVEPFDAPISLRADPTQISPYALKWDIDAPSITLGVADDGTFLSQAAIQFSDLLGNHRVQVIAASVSDFSNYNATYLNLKRRYNWGVGVYDFRDYFLRADLTGRIARDRIFRQTGAQAFIQYPFNRSWRVESSVGFLDEARDLLAQDQFGFFFQRFGDRFATVGASVTGSTARYQSYWPFQGKYLNLSLLHGFHLSGDREGDISEARLDLRTYRQATRRSTLAWRVGSIYNFGDRQNTYGFGGLNQLRGYEFREFIGSRMAWMNLEFRFPLIDELRFPVLRLGQIRGFFFVDAGGASFEDDLWYDRRGRFNPIGQAGIRTDETGAAIPFEVWDSENDRLQDVRASYGTGFQFIFLGGLQFNWVWSKRLDYTEFVWNGTLGSVEKVKADGGGTRSDFYIAFDW